MKFPVTAGNRKISRCR